MDSPPRAGPGSMCSTPARSPVPMPPSATPIHLCPNSRIPNRPSRKNILDYPISYYLPAWEKQPPYCHKTFT